MIWSKILPEAKSVSSQCTTVVFFFLFLFSPKTEVKRNVQKFRVLTGKERLTEESVIRRTDGGTLFSFIHTVHRDVSLPFTFPQGDCCFFTPRLFGCSPPGFSSHQKSRSPSPLSSSFPACSEQKSFKNTPYMELSFVCFCFYHTVAWKAPR